MNNQLKNFFGDNVIALFSAKKDGSMRLFGNDEWDRPIFKRRGDFCKSNIPNIQRLVSAQLVHGNHSEIISKPYKTEIEIGYHELQIKNCDALITGEHGVYLSTTAADCFPIYFYDPVQEVCGIIHAGWKGILRGVIESTFEKAEAGLNLQTQTTKVYVGPGIRKWHFEVMKDVADQFKEFTEEVDGKYYVDLEAAIEQRLLNIGILPDNLSISNRCTSCYVDENNEPEYFSFRRDKSDPLETQMTVIGMK